MGLNFYADKVVLTSGTFLGGVIHIGQSNFEGGRAGDAPSNPLSRTLRAYDLGVGRLKNRHTAKIGMAVRLTLVCCKYNRVIPRYQLFLILEKHRIIHSRSPVTLPIRMKKPMISFAKV